MSPPLPSTPWLLGRRSAARVPRLFCFDCAGGNALSFGSWQERLGPSVEVCPVQLPGRGARFAEPPVASLRALVKSLAAVVGPATDVPYAFFGHSLGGLVAFELARWFRLQYLPAPGHLFVAGCAAPQRRSEPGRGAPERLHTLSDDALVDALRAYNGTPPELLAHRELMTLVLPAVRADFMLVDTYEYRSSLPLTMPITVLAGRADTHLSREQVEGWRAETTGPCRVEWFDGDHFFLHPERDAVLRLLDRSWPGPLPDADPTNAPGPMR